MGPRPDVGSLRPILSPMTRILCEAGEGSWGSFCWVSGMGVLWAPPVPQRSWPQGTAG